MKTKSDKSANGDTLRDEYDFASMSGGVRGRYSRRLEEGTSIAVLEPEPAKAFPDDEAVSSAEERVLRPAKTLRRAR